MALSITHYAYRNTKLEDFHSDGIKMDKEFYRKMYDIVRAKLNNVRLLQRYVDEFPYENITDKETYKALIGSVPEELHLKFIKYLEHVVFGFDFGTNWDAAYRVEPIVPGQSLAGYVLSGKFSECCKNGARLDDPTMCSINKDVHNRIYTLLVDGSFNK